jgi:predicted nucleic acid-binding Zn ribbon protein
MARTVVEEGSRKTVAVECTRCGNIDRVTDALIVLALHKCSACQAAGGKVILE